MHRLPLHVPPRYHITLPPSPLHPSRRLCGLPFKDVGYLPLAHIPSIVRLLVSAASRKAGCTRALSLNAPPHARNPHHRRGASSSALAGPPPPASPLAPRRCWRSTRQMARRSCEHAAVACPPALQSTRLGSKAPACTECLPPPPPATPAALLSLLQNSSLISRYAALHAAKLTGAPVAAAQLYGPSLSVDAQRIVGGSDELYKRVTQLELRIGGDIGVEVRRALPPAHCAACGMRHAARSLTQWCPHCLSACAQSRRLAYFHLLPRTKLAGALFSRNSRSGVLAWLSYLASRLLLPRLLAINASTAARSRARLLAEWDHFDGLLAARQQEQRYLCGPQLSAADVALAALGGVVVGVPPELAPPGVWTPGLEQLPPELRTLVQVRRGADPLRQQHTCWVCQVHQTMQAPSSMHHARMPSPVAADRAAHAAGAAGAADRTVHPAAVARSWPPGCSGCGKAVRAWHAWRGGG